MRKIKISELKAETGVGFGTSGIRDLAINLTSVVVYTYTTAFLAHLKNINELKDQIAVAGDLRLSTDEIMLIVCRACKDFGVEVINCGKIPTPAVAYFGVKKNVPSIMVTGSHIPGDRNGVKFNLANREILKSDEEVISQMEVEIDEKLVDIPLVLPDVNKEAETIYINRYVDFFGNNLLSNKVVGLYGHSAVGRDIFRNILEQLGAKVVAIEYSDIFVPIDTDAVDENLVAKMKQWKLDFNLDYIVSTDGDGDRPLLTDEEGNFIRADLMPIIAAEFFGIEALATSLTANTAVEKSGFFKKVVRVRVGSPYICEAMMILVKEGFKKVAGYELNGGFLLESNLNNLSRLPTRDAILVILGVLAKSNSSGILVKQLFENLPKRSTYSLSIKGIPTNKSLAVIEDWKTYRSEIENMFGKITNIDQIDGLRLTFENGEIVHFRPSKNAPEFRNYVEAATYDRARHISEMALELTKKWTA